MQARRAVLDWAEDHVDDRAVLSDIALAITEAKAKQPVVAAEESQPAQKPGKQQPQAEKVISMPVKKKPRYAVSTSH